jgi:hypothetical protein
LERDERYEKMIIHTENLSGTTVSGALSVNTKEAMMGIVREIIVTPATTSTVYNLAITNSNSQRVFYSASITGIFAEEVALPFRGIYTVTISGGTRDEAFQISIVLEE